MKTIRKIRICGEVAYVPLTKGYEAVIDSNCVHLVEGFNWFANISGNAVYALRNRSIGGGKQTKVMMHRVIAATPNGFETDHIDKNTLNNRKSNLRTATHSQNNHNRGPYKTNSSGHKGVQLHKRTGQWRAVIRCEGSRFHLGLFNTPEEAAKAYEDAAKRLHGEFARVS